MFVKLGKNRVIGWPLWYNEMKVKKGQAECLHAENFVKDLPDLSQKEKLYHFERLAILNHNVQKPIMHLSVNFPPREIFASERLVALSRELMRNIGLDRQPYLIYQHMDSLHPHVHIICPRVRPDGSIIETPRKFLYHLLEVCREMEVAHKLVPNIRHDLHGEGHGIRQQIHQALDKVLGQFQYTNLQELNAVLQGHGVRAQAVYKVKGDTPARGLLYWLLNAEGQPFRSPIKASMFAHKPTLPYLEKQFLENNLKRVEDMTRLRAGITMPIDWALRQQAHDLPGLIRALGREGITVVMIKDKQGVAQDVCYIDRNTKAVFEGASLGAEYTLSALQRRCPDLTEEQRQALRLKEEQRQQLRNRIRL